MSSPFLGPIPAPVTGEPPALDSPEFAALIEWETGEDERHVVRTEDGWNITLYRYRAQGNPREVPILCGHGLAGSRLIYDVHPKYSMARALAADGFDVWLMDMRGRNESWPDGGADETLQWCFDDFVFQDIPAAAKKVQEVTGADGIGWLGTEMSGIALYAMAISNTVPGLRGGITMGSPAITSPDGEVPGVTTPYPERGETRYEFSMVRHIGPALAAERSEVIDGSFRNQNTDWLVVARYFAHGVPDEATAIIDQFKDWMDSQSMRSRDGSMVWSDWLGEITIPIMVAAGGNDRQRPPAGARATYEALGSKEKEWFLAGVETGFPIDVGHDDFLTGLCSPSMIFPRLAEWLDAHVSPRA